MATLTVQQIIELVTREQDIRASIARVARVLKVGGLLIVWRALRGGAGAAARLAAAAATVATAYPWLLRATGSRWAAWNGTIGAGLALAGGVPEWLASYVAVEAAANAGAGLDAAVGKAGPRTRVLLKQAVAAVLVVALHQATVKAGLASRALFARRSFAMDFALFYGVWNALSLGRMAKQALLGGRRVPERRRATADADEELAPNAQHLVRRLRELNELAGAGSERVEKLLGGTVGRNFTICLKWAIWRQTVSWLFNCRPVRNVGGSQKVAVIMLSFLALNGDEYLNVNGRMLRFLLRSVVTQLLAARDPLLRPLLMVAGLNLEFYFYGR
ncbi:AGR308Wp [Eremothecium gossypii ATCC 10895]|uniref:AGR308Wp n=1 Tax=Eremothecium gossypii (strain ATCC 10895 / CBS 109.51 / FGSC 9923 / NRRL Y-1056) TaxID=284811 RepID=Q74Z95_EREGS|nr:AGR308Wp [Eremothecium gossypii ATCC 10895]AAS54798.2 AGR308Wp [Eremothecium gossypii ATCC 10895]AEY99129.1 FAGR308Wp [Eremothecium gossypii FDAG1]